MIKRINTSELKHTFDLSLPIIIGQIGFVLMGVADTVMVGRLGKEPLAAAGVANGVFFLISVLGLGTVMAISPLVSKSLGEGKETETGKIFQAGIWAAIIASLVLMIPMGVIAQNFEWLKQENQAVTTLAGSYLWIVTPSLLPMLLFMAMKHFSDGLELVRPAMLITLGGLLLNILLNWLFIWGWGPVPAMGLDGAGIATALSRVVMMALMVLVLFWNKEMYTAIRALAGAPLRQHLIQIFKLGVPTGLQYFFEVAAFGGAAIIIGWIGAAEQAAHQIALNPASVTYMIITGVSSAGAIRVGNALGAKDQAGIRRAGNSAFTIAVSFMALTCLVFLFGRELIIHLYLDAEQEMEVTGIATSLLLIAAIFQLSDGIQAVGLGVLRGLQDVRIPTMITMIAYWVIGIPSGCLFAFYFNWGVYGIWAGLTLGLTFSAIAQTVRFYYLVNKTNLTLSDNQVEKSATEPLVLDLNQ